MSQINTVPFLSSDGLGNDLNQARKLFDNRAAISFRSHSLIANSPFPLIDRRSVAGAAAFQYYMFGRMPTPSKEYQSGDDVLGQDYTLKNGQVNVDDIILGSGVIGEKDSIVSHISMMPYIAQETGRQVALELDRRILNQHALAARTAALTDTTTGLTVHNGGLRVTRSGGSATVATAMAAAYPLSAAGAANLRADLRNLNYLADQNYWPEDQRKLICDVYLRQVLQYDPNAAQWASADYIDGQNNLVQRRVMEIEGWKIMHWVNRNANDGILPDTNITSYVKSTKFNANFVPQASVGYPCVMAFGADSDENAAVGFGTWQGIRSDVFWKQWQHVWLGQTWCLTGIEKSKVYSAGSIEVIL